MTLRLADLEAPLDDVEFPNGAKHVPVPFGPTEYRLWRDIQKEPDAQKRGTMCFQIITACYPAATVEDIDSCTPTMLIALAAHAGHKIEQIRDALKNVAAAATPESPPSPNNPPATVPSSPKTNGSTSSRKSRARSGNRGTPSDGASHTDGRNSSGGTSTISTTPSGSTPSDVSSTPSTVPF